jgi:hypothetical protein
VLTSIYGMGHSKWFHEWIHYNNNIDCIGCSIWCARATTHDPTGLSFMVGWDFNAKEFLENSPVSVLSCSLVDSMGSGMVESEIGGVTDI